MASRASCVKACAPGVACATALVFMAVPCALILAALPGLAAPKMAQAGLLAWSRLPLHTFPAGQPVVFVRGIVLTALGTRRSCTAFPILPLRHRIGHLRAGMIAADRPRISYAISASSTPGSKYRAP